MNTQDLLTGDAREVGKCLFSGDTGRQPDHIADSRKMVTDLQPILNELAEYVRDTYGMSGIAEDIRYWRPKEKR